MLTIERKRGCKGEIRGKVPRLAIVMIKVLIIYNQ